MRNIELITAISDETCIPRAEVQVTLETFFRIIKDTVINGEKLLPDNLSKLHSHITLNFSNGDYKIFVLRENLKKPLELPQS